jgi:hypothetical protein
MKRFLAYCLLAVTLLIGVTSVSICKNEIARQETRLNEDHKSIPDQQQYSLSSTNMLFSIGIGNDQVRLSNSFQHISFRILPSLSNTLRLIRSEQLVNQKLFTGYTIFLLKSAFKQLDGYYLYHLRKLLI